ncbi:MAG: hypothetical protein AB8B77_02740 [Alphaproteobacteria bacterium]
MNDISDKIAVIDIGSNSIRLVIFDQLDLAPVSVFNEKELCGIGQNMDQTGELYPDGVAQAMRILPRFLKITQAFAVKQCYIVATSAARDAVGGDIFLKQIEDLFGQKVMLLSGESEGRYSALGLLAGFVDAHGIMGDLGGGSLELVGINAPSPAQKSRFAAINETTSLALGPVRLAAHYRENPIAARPLIDKALDSLDWLQAYRGRNFYCVGGAWRNLAKLHMSLYKAKLHVIDHYGFDGDHALEFTKMVSEMTIDQLLKYPEISKKRALNMPYSAYLLHLVLKRLEPETVFFSANGLREGIVVEAAQRTVDQHDFKPDQFKNGLKGDDPQSLPLMLACRKLAGQNSLDADFIDGEAVYDWLSPLIEAAIAAVLDNQTPPAASPYYNGWRLNILAQAACILCDFGSEEHPDYRSDHAAMRILRSSIVGLSHEERMFLAATLCTRFGGSAKQNPDLSDFQTSPLYRFSLLMGAALRFAYLLSLGQDRFLNAYRIALVGGQLQLVIADPAIPLHQGEAIQKRLQMVNKQLALIFNS